MNLRGLKSLSWAILLVAGCGASLVFAETPGPRFAVYLVDIADEGHADTLHGHKRDLPVQYHLMGQEYVSANWAIREPPVLTDLDIVDYCWNEQTIVLTPEAVERWHGLGGWHVPLQGIPLLVVVDGTPCYGAMLWNLLSSSGTNLPAFVSHVLGDKLVTGGKSLRTIENPSPDVRYDPRVREVMASLGKFTETCLGDNSN